MAKTLLPEQDVSTNGKILKSDGADASWNELTASEVGAEESGSVATGVEAHNTSETSHTDIREQLSAKADKAWGEWITPTLTGGATEVDSVNFPVRCRINDLGVVEWTGRLNNPTIGYRISMPAEYRPQTPLMSSVRRHGGYSATQTIGVFVTNTINGIFIAADTDINLSSLRYTAGG